MGGRDVLHTEICDMLRIDVPVISAGMGFVARAEHDTLARFDAAS